MTVNITIALDAMGGDKAPELVIDGAATALQRMPELRFLLVGDETRLRPLVDAKPALKAAAEIVHTADAVTNDSKPSQVLRSRTTSMRMAIDAVADGRAGAVVSAGNTGALMAIGKLVLKTLPGIDRPAIAGYFPNRRSECVMLDLGANVDCDVDNLVQFSVMGAAFARIVLNIQEPSIGMLNVGSEEMKGRETVRQAAAALRANPPPGSRFHGFVEGDDIMRGTTDVVVTDGFTGNVALKTIEGTSKLVSALLREALASSFTSKIGYLLTRKALNRLRAKVDPRRHNGALFLGLRGICVKSHGGTDDFGFANAIGVAADMVRHKLNDRICDELERMRAHREAAAALQGAQAASR